MHAAVWSGAGMLPGKEYQQSQVRTDGMKLRPSTCSVRLTYLFLTQSSYVHDRIRSPCWDL